MSFFALWYFLLSTLYSPCSFFSSLMYSPWEPSSTSYNTSTFSQSHPVYHTTQSTIQCIIQLPATTAARSTTQNTRPDSEVHHTTASTCHDRMSQDKVLVLTALQTKLQNTTERIRNHNRLIVIESGNFKILARKAKGTTVMPSTWGGGPTQHWLPWRCTQLVYKPSHVTYPNWLCTEKWLFWHCEVCDLPDSWWPLSAELVETSLCRAGGMPCLHTSSHSASSASQRSPAGSSQHSTNVIVSVSNVNVTMSVSQHHLQCYLLVIHSCATIIAMPTCWHVSGDTS